MYFYCNYFLNLLLLFLSLSFVDFLCTKKGVFLFLNVIEPLTLVTDNFFNCFNRQKIVFSQQSG